MVTAQDIEDARANARVAVLQAIATKAGEDSDSLSVLRLAEAFAWLTSSNQSHGGPPGAAT